MAVPKPANPVPSTNLFAQYDFSDSTKVTLSGSNITQILDSSGNGRTLTQATSTQQPTLLTAAQNGLNTASFDGTNDNLISSATSSINEVSIYGVMYIESSGNADLVYGGIGEAASNKLRAFYVPNTSVAMNLASYGSNWQSTLSLDLSGSYHSWGGVFTSPTSVSILKDASTQSGNLGSSIATSTSPQISLGGFGTTFPAKVRIGEFLVYNVAHNSTQSAAVMSYLKTKWGTP